MTHLSNQPVNLAKPATPLMNTPLPTKEEKPTSASLKPAEPDSFEPAVTPPRQTIIEATQSVQTKVLASKKQVPAKNKKGDI